MKLINQFALFFTLSLLTLTACGGDDGSPTDDGNGNGAGTELLSSDENLWLVTASTLHDQCAACDNYTLVWQNKGWALVTQFGELASTCYNQNCYQTKLNPFVLKEMTVTPHFNLSGYSTAKLRWDEAHRDYSSVSAYVSPDGGTTWTLLSNVDHTSTSSVEEARTVEITQYLGSAKGNVRVRFVLVAGANGRSRRDTGSDKYSCRAEIKEVQLTGYK